MPNQLTRALAKVRESIFEYLAVKQGASSSLPSPQQSLSVKGNDRGLGVKEDLMNTVSQEFKVEQGRSSLFFSFAWKVVFSSDEIFNGPTFR